jgi:ubiquitin C-terminal hydrolase
MNQFIQAQLKPLMELIKKPTAWKYAPSGGSGDMQKYVGLVNLGAVCYMNSMNQLFFMIPAFRYNLLSVIDGKEPNIQRCRKGS